MGEELKWALEHRSNTAVISALLNTYKNVWQISELPSHADFIMK